MSSTTVLRPVRTFSVAPIPPSKEALEHLGIPVWCDDLVRLVRSQRDLELPSQVVIQSSELVCDGLQDTDIRAAIAKPRSVACGTILGILAQYLRGDRELIAPFPYFNVAYTGERKTVYFQVNKLGLITAISAIDRNKVPVWKPGTRFFHPAPITK